MNLRLRLDSHCSSVSSSSRPPGELPAQVTRMSIFPNLSRVWSTQRATSSGRLMSPARGTIVRPDSCSISRAAASSGPAVRAVMTTSAPSPASCRATCRPMPLLAPVTKATLSVSSRSNRALLVVRVGSWPGWYFKYRRTGSQGCAADRRPCPSVLGVQAPAQYAPGADAEHLVVEEGHHLLAAAQERLGFSAYLDPAHPPGVHGGDVVDHEGDSRIREHVAPLLPLGEAVTADVDRVLVRVV